MLKLIALYFGTIILMWLSNRYYPVDVEAEEASGRHFIRRKADIFMWMAILWMTCFMFLRTSYNDTGNYIWQWRNADDVDVFIENGGLLDITGNPLSYLWESFAHTYIKSFNTYFIPASFLISFVSVKFFKRYSTNLPFTMLVFHSIGTYIMFMAAMKQCFAMFILLVAVPFAEKKQYVRFYLLVIFAMLFHTHAFMFAIVPFLFEKPWRKVTWMGIAAVLFMMATYDATLGAFMEYAQSLGVNVADIEVFDGHQINIIRIFVYWVPSVIALIFQKRLFANSTRYENLFVNMTTVSAAILTIGTVQAANLFARMAAYFEIASALALPWMIGKLFEKNSAKFIITVASVLYFGYFLYEFGVSKGFGYGYKSISIMQYLVDIFGG